MQAAERLEVSGTHSALALPRIYTLRVTTSPQSCAQAAGQIQVRFQGTCGFRNIIFGDNHSISRNHLSDANAMHQLSCVSVTTVLVPILIRPEPIQSQTPIWYSHPLVGLPQKPAHGVGNTPVVRSLRKENQFSSKIENFI